MVSSRWKRTANGIALDVTIPVNSQAKVSVPKVGLGEVVVSEGSETIWEDGRLAGRAEGITEGRESADTVTFEVGSGSYGFRLSGTLDSAQGAGGE